MACACDYEPPSFHSRKAVKARKTYHCVECSGEIRPGERYERVTGMWDGYIDRYQTCRRCHDIRQWVKNNVPCFCWGYGNLDEDAKIAVDDAHYRAPLETAGLRFGLRRRFVQRDRFNAERRAAA